MIELKNVSKTFASKDQNVEAVKNVSLSINDGEIFGIIGFSGAGKSTLVRCINLLEKPTSGEVLIDNTDLTKLKEKDLRAFRSQIGMIFQQFNLLSQSTVLDNIAFPLLIAGKPKKEAREKARALLKTVELEEKENAYPSQLSGGQKQRVAIARALATSPKVLLCDEATSALDPITTRSILSLLKKINSELKITIVVITHEMKVVEQICERVAVMSKGVVEEVGFVKDIFLHPQSETGKRLVLPGEESTINLPTKDYIRITFDGQSSYEPVLASLVLESGEKLNILGASTEDIGGAAYGQMFIETPSDERVRSKIYNWLNKNNVKFEEVEVENNGRSDS